jgi:predicted MarR family transcription regulator
MEPGARTLADTTPEIDELLAASVRTIEEVELLVHVVRHADQPWSVQELSDQLGMSEDAAQIAGTALAQRGLLSVTASGEFTTAPVDAATAATLQGLVAFYATRRISVLNAVHSARLRRLQSLADAFRLKPPKGD